MNRNPPPMLAHVVYRTRRFDEMLRWYAAVFGARIVTQNPAIAFLGYDEEHHRFAVINLNVVKPGGESLDNKTLVGIDHVAYRLGTLNDLFDRYATLAEAGIRPYWCVHHGVTVSMYYADPDGNQTEFQVDAFSTKQEGTDCLRGPTFEANPVGVEFDPDAWLRRLRGGTPAAELLRRPSNEPMSPIRGTLEIAH